MSDKELQGVVSDIAFGGYGVIKHEGMVVFVPYTMMNEKISFIITQQKKRFAYGKLLQILSPHPERVIPRCPYFTKCGGCQLQHMDYGSQISHKKDFAKTLLKKIGNIDCDEIDIVGSQNQYGYRRHIKLHLFVSNGQYQMGYYQTDNKTLIAIDQCPIFSDQSLITCAKEIVQKIKPINTDQKASLLIIQGLNGPYFVFYFEKEVPENCSNIFKDYQKICSILLRSKNIELSFGDTNGKLLCCDESYNFSLKGFVQNNAEQSQNIYKEIVAKCLMMQVKQVLDLYCGIGITSIMLAKENIKTWGIEENIDAISCAKENAKIHKVNCTFIAGDAAKASIKLIKTIKFDGVLVNPPRCGLSDEMVQSLIKMLPSVLIYVSCHPATMARDQKILKEAGYRIQKMSVYDMFPQTSHLEVMITLKRSNPV
ncbi:MAG: class I SAM-dependent RNA methyltransferase [Parachlamydiales bacterium]|nr:class I SAM-dependent RNA methyltransferase [Parachlamydiales bacterium]